MAQQQVFYCLLAILLSQGLAYLANAQLACPSFTLADLGSNTSLSTDGLLSTALGLGGEGGIDVEAQVVNYRILCDASGSMRGTSSYVSVLVQFMCSEASINVCNRTIVVTRQFQFSCGVGDMWIANIFGSANNVQTLNPTATFETTPSNQCRACVDDEQITNPNIDTATHCFCKYLVTLENYVHALYYYSYVDCKKILYFYSQPAILPVTRDRCVAI